MRAELSDYFSSLEMMLEPLSVSARIALFERERETWERRECKLRKAAARDERNPFHPPLTAWDCAHAILEIGKRISALRDDLPAPRQTHAPHYADLAALEANAWAHVARTFGH